MKRITLLLPGGTMGCETQQGLDYTSQERADAPLKRKEGHRLSQNDAHLAASNSLQGL